MNKIALIIGRFQPMHLGHLNLIDRYYKAGFFIKIAIGSSQKSYEKHNPLTSKERKEKIRRAMKEYKIKRYKIYNIRDIKDDSKYVKYVLRKVGRFDVILTGNPFILKLFLDYKSRKPWNIESFEEKSGRPGGNVTSGDIRKRWIKGTNKKGLPKSVFEYLKAINFSERVKKAQR